MRIELTIYRSPKDSYQWEFTGQEFEIGRNPDCQLCISTASSSLVGWNHAKVIQRGRDAFVTDLKSLKGTYINGKRIMAIKRIGVGDEIELGESGPRLRVTSLQVDVLSAEQAGRDSQPSVTPTAAVPADVPTAAPRVENPAASKAPALSPARLTKSAASVAGDRAPLSKSIQSDQSRPGTHRGVAVLAAIAVIITLGFVAFSADRLVSWRSTTVAETSDPVPNSSPNNEAKNPSTPSDGPAPTSPPQTGNNRDKKPGEAPPATSPSNTSPASQSPTTNKSDDKPGEVPPTTSPPKPAPEPAPKPAPEPAPPKAEEKSTTPVEVAPDAKRESLSDSLFLIVVEEPKSGMIWGIANATAISDQQLLTNGLVAVELAKLKAKGCKIHALRKSLSERTPIDAIRVHRGTQNDSADQQIYFDYAILVTSKPHGVKPATLATPAEITTLEQGMPLQMPTIPFGEDPIDRSQQMQPQTFSAKIYGISRLAPDGGAPLLGHVRGKFPDKPIGCPLFNDQGHMVGVYADLEAQAKGAALLQMHYVPLITPGILEPTMNSQLSQYWVEPVIKTASPPEPSPSPASSK